MINVSYRMRHFKPRWALTIDPHLFINGQHIGRLERVWNNTAVDTSGELVVVVAPSDSPSQRKLDPEFGPSLFSPYVYRTVNVNDGDQLRIDYRPNLLYGYLLRGSLAVGGNQSSHPR